MTKRIYKVVFDTKWKSNISGKTYWMEGDSKTVLGNGDAQKVIDKVRQNAINERDRSVDADGTKYDDTCIVFRLNEVIILSTVDL